MSSCCNAGFESGAPVSNNSPSLSPDKNVWNPVKIETERIMCEKFNTSGRFFYLKINKIINEVTQVLAWMAAQLLSELN